MAKTYPQCGVDKNLKESSLQGGQNVMVTYKKMSEITLIK